MLRILAVAALPFLMLAAAPAMAQQDDPYAPCAAMTQDAERLACFDATHAAQRVVIAERTVVEEARREEVFGFRDEDRVIELAEAEDEDEITLTATVSEMLEGARRSRVVLLDNGQLWREVSGSTMRNRPREGWVATISRHWSGVYEMRFEGRSGYMRVARVQ